MNMKNKIFISVFLFFLSGLLLECVAQKEQPKTRKSPRTEKRQKKYSKEEVFYTLPLDETFAHWSYMINLGGSIFDGDVWEENGQKLVPSSNFKFTGGFAIERTFNPIYGLALEYNYIPYGAKPEDPVIYKLKGTAHEVDVYLSISLLNLFYHRRPQKWNVYGNLGLGMAFYNAEMNNKNTGETMKLDGHEMKLDDGVSAVIPISLLVEYNINKNFAVGMKAEYRTHNKDNLEGSELNIRKGTSNDGFSMLTVTFRHKLHFDKNHHTRNISYGEPENKELNKRIAELEKEIAALKTPVKSDTDSCCNALAQKIDDLSKKIKDMDTAIIQKVRDTVVIEKESQRIVERIVKDTIRIKEVVMDKTLDRDGDGVADADDKCPDLKGDPANYGCPKIKEKSRKVFNRALRGIQFETNLAVIKSVSYPILQEVVAVMKENPDYQVEIIGHTDNVGGAEYNLELSEKRSASVARFLENNGINSSRISTSGMGLSRPVATNETPEGRALNRRVEFVVKSDKAIKYDTGK